VAVKESAFEMMIVLGGLSDKALFPGLLKILYICRDGLGCSSSVKGSFPVPEAPSESLNVK